MRLTDAAGCGLEILPEKPIHFDLRHETIGELRAAAHDHALHHHAESILHLDAAHGPIGGDMGGIQMEENERLRGGVYTLRFVIRPV